MSIKPWILSLSLVIGVMACQPPEDKSGEAKGILPYPIVEKKLENGANVVTVPYPSDGIAAFYIIMRVGSMEEVEEGKTGFAHFFEHMMFRGTENISKEEYNEILKSIGAAANANTWLDRTVYHMTGNADMLEKMFEIEADRFMNLQYSIEDFKAEAGAVKGEYTKNSASPYSQINEKIQEAAFTTHTYGHTTMGYWEDVVDMPNQYDYSQTFYDRFYRPEYATILVVGDADPDQVYNLAQKYFGKWERGSYKPEIPTEPEQTETRFAHVQRANFPPYLRLAYKTPGFDAANKDVAALNVISSLAFSKKAPLYKKLVEQEQKLRSLGSSYFFTRDPYLFSIQASFKSEEDMQYVKDELEKELNKLKEEPVSEEELEEVKSHLKYDFAMEIDNPTEIAEQLTYFIWVSGDPNALNTYYDTMESLTPADIQAAAQKYFTADKLTIATISPSEEGGVQ